MLGASGAGKSSSCACWPGCRRPAPARSTWKASGWPAHPRWPWRSRIRAFLPWLTLERNVAFGLTSSISRKCWMRASARGAWTWPSRKSACRTPASCGRAQLSGGMAQRTALARCLARQPAVLLLDEPFGALDEVTRAECRLLRKVVADVGAAALLITHDIDDEALLLADRMVLLLSRRPAACWANGPWTRAAAARRPAARNGRAVPGNTVPPARALGRTRGVRTGGTCLTLIRARHKEPRMCLEHMSRRDWLKLTALLSAGGRRRCCPLSMRAPRPSPTRRCASAICRSPTPRRCWWRTTTACSTRPASRPRSQCCAAARR